MRLSEKKPFNRFLFLFGYAIIVVMVEKRRCAERETARRKKDKDRRKEL